MQSQNNKRVKRTNAAWVPPRPQLTSANVQQLRSCLTEHAPEGPKHVGAITGGTTKLTSLYLEVRQKPRPDKCLPELTPTEAPMSLAQRKEQEVKGFKKAQHVSQRAKCPCKDGGHREQHKHRFCKSWDSAGACATHLKYWWVLDEDPESTNVPWQCEWCYAIYQVCTLSETKRGLATVRRGGGQGGVARSAAYQHIRNMGKQPYGRMRLCENTTKPRSGTISTAATGTITPLELEGLQPRVALDKDKCETHIGGWERLPEANRKTKRSFNCMNANINVNSLDEVFSPIVHLSNTLTLEAAQAVIAATHVGVWQR